MDNEINEINLDQSQRRTPTHNISGINVDRFEPQITKNGQANRSEEKTTHNKKQIKPSADVKGIAKSDEDDREDKNSNDLSCKECGKSYRKPEHLKYHLSSAHSRKQTTSEEKFICEICNAVRRSAKSLKKHTQYKHGERKYPCKICGQAFQWNSYLSRHMEAAHQILMPTPKEIRKYKCDVCKQAFKFKKNMEQHHYIAHVLQKAFDCQFCQKHCLGKEDHEAHMKKYHSYHLTSLKSKPKYFDCQVCQTKFQTFEMLQRHLANSHTSKKDGESSMDDELIPCGKCNMSFKSIVDWNRHLNEQRVVTVIQCNYCMDKFNHKCHFYTHHFQYHQEKKPIFKCTLCDTSVTNYDLLNTHEFIFHSEVARNSSESVSGHFKSSTEKDDLANDCGTKTVNHCIKNDDGVKQVKVENCNIIEVELIKIEKDNNIKHVMFDEGSNN